MAIDITQKSKELKEFLSQYETIIFLGDISSLIHFISFEHPTKSLQGLSSPLRQLYYVAGLNLTSAIDEGKALKPQYSDEEWEHIKELLNEIERGYEELFYPKEDEEIDEDWKIRRMVAMPTFLSYFNQGTLNYEEQILERVEKYFAPFENAIEKAFGLKVGDFVDIYNYIDSLPNKFLEETINKREGLQTWEEFATEMSEKDILPFDWQKHMPEHFKKQFNFMYDKGSMNRFKKQNLVDAFGTNKTEAFLNVMTSQRGATNYLYYTEQNPLHIKPFFLVGNDEYQFIESLQIIQSIYNTLFSFCANDKTISDKLYATRGDELESKIKSIFKNFFGDKVHVYRSFYTQDKHEQDLMFLIDNFAFIVEAKASKRDEPRRDPDMAYPLILSNFEETIQKGYDQAYRVKNKFIKNETLKIYKDQELKKHLIDIRTKNYHGAYSIVVTLERFGQIQNDLSELLEIWDDDEYPWSVCVDDLESFLLLMKKQGKKPSDLAEFLRIREKLHGKLICTDELEVCGGFLNNLIGRKQTDSDEVLALTPDLSGIFDDAYHKGGLGFDNEKNMHLKTSDKYMILGGH